jgi:hypothetical protein
MRLGKNIQVKLLAFFFIIATTASGQTGKNYKYRLERDVKKNSVVSSDNSLIINYSISELNIVNSTDENGTFYRIAVPGHIPSSDVGKPEFPMLCRLIRIPENCTYKISITDVRTSKIRPSGKKIKGILFPVQEGETKDLQKKKTVFTIDKSIYSTRGFLKTDTVRIEPLGTVRHKNLANLLISPVRYNPHSNTLEVITSMKIEISFNKTGSKDQKALFPESVAFNEVLGKGVLDYSSGDLITGYSDKPVKMIILTDTAFKKHLQPFIKWKIQKGFDINVLYMGAKYAGNTYTELKDTLTKIYDSSTSENPPPEYLLIVGDVNKVPYYGTGNTTDMYYGEFDGNGDYIPEMFIGRLPVADTTELRSVVNKIIQYEKFEFTPANKFYSYGLITAGSDAGNADIMNGQVKYGIENYLIPQNKINEYHFYYPQDLGQQKDSIIKLINKGLSFINYTGHGEYDRWKSLDIKVADTSKLKNSNMYPFIISNACYTGQFDIPYSFGNRMVVSRNKGAIGFIGCSNSSYWNEDFYWSVGVGTPGDDPTYETTGLGAYDRLFHTHGESPSDWYISMGQVNYSGNLAVSSSTSLHKKYYWETYNLLGDPSVIPIIGTPDTFNVVLPDTLPNNIKSYSFITDPFSYIAISHFDTLWDASYVSPSGSITLEMPGMSNDSCLVVITGQNKVPLIKTIYFSTINKEFINLSKSCINDSFGNNNGLADFGEKISIDLTINNFGSAGAGGLFARISSSSEWITINTDSAYIGTLAAGVEKVLQNKLLFTLSDSIPDKEKITLDLILKDSMVEKLYEIDICIHAPKLDILSYSIDDSFTGNGNYFADPGETFKLVFQVQNQGSSNTSGQLKVSSSNSDITVLEPSKNSGIIRSGEVIQITVLAKISETASNGTAISFVTLLNYDPYLITKNYAFRIGRIRESFESASFKVFPWINISSKPWIITGSDRYEGYLAARSGVITDNQSSSLAIKTMYSADDSLRFWYKVSSEQGCDYLIFKLNGTEIFRKSGEISWEKKAVPVPAGSNKMEWIYKKDNSYNYGSDCAMIDMIDFAESSSITYINRDIVAARLISPVQKKYLEKEPVTLKLLDLGPDTVKGFNLAYTINNDAPVNQYFNETLIPFGDSLTVTFNSRADLSYYGSYDIVVYSFDNNDDYLKNDTLSVSVRNNDIDGPVLVYPNPFNEKLNILINASDTGTAHITLTNSAGIKIMDFDQEVVAGTNSTFISGNNLAPAVYYLRIRTGGFVKTLPVIRIKQ